MTILVAVMVGLLVWTPQAEPNVDVAALWREATPFPTFLEKLTARRDQWTSRFANAAIEAEAIDRVRALPGKRRLLAVAEARCSDSAWAVPFLAKLAAAVPDKLELRVIPAAQGSDIQAANPTPDGRRATPTIAVLDADDRVLGVWVERPAALQKWYVDNKATTSTSDRYAHLNAWYTSDAGRTTITEVLAILERQTPAAGAPEGN